MEGYSVNLTIQARYEARAHDIPDDEKRSEQVVKGVVADPNRPAMTRVEFWDEVMKAMKELQLRIPDEVVAAALADFYEA